MTPQQASDDMSGNHELNSRSASMSGTALTFQDLENFLDPDEINRIEEKAKSMVEDSCKYLRTEESLRNLAITWSSRAAEYKHALECLVGMLPKFVSKDDENVAELLSLYVQYRYLKSAVEHLGLPEDDNTSLMIKQENETPYEYVKRIKYYR